jgi:hydroxymethylpyrimidine pyrophosphatase-like HAD family hydrolase
MRYLALACDYDGTMATNGRVGAATIAALKRLRKSGRKLILVTGRELGDLQRVFPQLDLFDRVVAENGALLYCPDTRQTQALGPAPPAEFVAALRAHGVAPLSVGHVIVATWEPNETAVLATIRDLGLEMQVIFNKGAVMVLPSGINKAYGLGAALNELKLSAHNVVGIGDAENDHAFLAICECAAVVANALPTLQERADLVTEADHGAGVAELIDQLIADDLRNLELRLTRHHIQLGARPDGERLDLAPYGNSVLIAGSSGGGKSTLATGILERLIERGYQCCIIDPEGDYETFEGGVVLGDPRRAPSVDEVLDLLQQPSQHAIVNLLGVPLDDRPTYVEGLMARLKELRAQTGRPHWVMIDEAHHILPASRRAATLSTPEMLDGMLLITLKPESLAPAVLAAVDLLIATGEAPDQTITAFARATGQPSPAVETATLEQGEALAWRPHDGQPLRFRVVAPETVRLRHKRKYAEGDLAPELSFYFRGPEGKLNLRAQNLIMFLQLAEGVDDATWEYHLRNGDYSRWFREVIKDDELVSIAEEVERDRTIPTEESRARIRAAIEERYTLPA